MQKPKVVLCGVEDDGAFVPEIDIRYNSDREMRNIKFNESKDVAEFGRSLFDTDTIEVREKFIALYLNRANELKGYYIQGVGGVNGVIGDPRLIFAAALKCLCSQIILIHNHPSGDTSPSDADIMLTRKFKDSGKFLDIIILDHIIITANKYYSFADEGKILGGLGDFRKDNYTNTKPMISSNPKKVNHLTEEIKFIRRFVGLHNKIKTSNAILTFIKALQKSISQKLITKHSSFVKHINYIQDTLVEFYNQMKGEKKFKIEESTLAKMVAISGSEEVYPSVGFIKTFIGMQGKEISEEKRTSFLKRLHNAANNRKIYPNDPFADKLQKIYNYLKSGYKPGQKIGFAKAELSGLACICKSHDKAIGNIYDTKGKSVRRCRSGKYSDAKRGACSYNKGLAGIMTAEEVANMKFDLLSFSGEWEKLIGKPEKNFSMMIHGEPGAGKTVLLLKFTKYLSSLGSVLYTTSEEFGSATLTEKVNKYLNPLPSNVTFTSKLGIANISDYNFVIFDSITDLKISLEQFKSMKESNPNTAFILIMQNTKGGLFKGGKDWEHEVQIAGEVVNGVIQIYKNRYGNKGSMNFFDKN